MHAAIRSLKPTRQILGLALLLCAALLNIYISGGAERWQRGFLTLVMLTIYMANIPSIGTVKHQRKTFWALDGIFTYYNSLMLGSLMVIWMWPAETIPWGWRIYMWPVFMTGCAVAVYYVATSEKARGAREGSDITPINVILASMVAWLFLAYNGMFFKPALTPAQFAFFTMGLGFLVQPYAPADGPLRKNRVMVLRIAYIALVGMLGLDLL